MIWLSLPARSWVAGIVGLAPFVLEPPQLARNRRQPFGRQHFPVSTAELDLEVNLHDHSYRRRWPSLTRERMEVEWSHH